MTFRLTTFATPLQIARFRAKGNTNTNAKAKKHKNAPRMIEPLATFESALRWVELQLPIHVQAEQANGNFAHGRGVLYGRQKRAGTQIDAVLVALQTHFRSLEREAISEITLTRISSGKLDAHDNLRQAFKHVLDGVCAWICVGDGELNRHAIGRYDDKLLGTGKVTCHYDQTTHETDKRLQGIRIRLRLGSPAAPSTAP